MAVMVFEDGPAEGERIETSIEPEWTRWYCEYVGPAATFSPPKWWVIDRMPPEDEQVRVTRYDVKGLAAKEGGEKVYTFAVKED